MSLFELVLGFSLGVTSVIVVFIFKCTCNYSENRTIRNCHGIKGKLDSKVI